MSLGLKLSGRRKRPLLQMLERQILGPGSSWFDQYGENSRSKGASGHTRPPGGLHARSHFGLSNVDLDKLVWHIFSTFYFGAGPNWGQKAQRNICFGTLTSKLLLTRALKSPSEVAQCLACKKAKAVWKAEVRSKGGSFITKELPKSGSLSSKLGYKVNNRKLK